MKISDTRALEHVMAVLGVEGQSGQERPIADVIRKRLLDAGCRASWIREDGAARRLGAGFEVGNLIVKLPGRIRAPRRLLMAHMDVVPLCRGARAVRKGNRIVAAGSTALGADNRTSVAALLTMVEVLLRESIPHPPLTLLFTVAEENGLNGAKAVRLEELGGPEMAFNIDGGDPNMVCVGAVGATRWSVDIEGVSAHAGVHPEDGVSAILIASRAIARVAERGVHGAVRKGRRRGASNVGLIEGGAACNQVPDRVQVRGECRSHSAAFLRTLDAEYRRAFEWAARSVRNAQGTRGKAVIRQSAEYPAFRLPLSAPAVRVARAAVRGAGLEPKVTISDGGLDANPLNARGLPTVTFGSGHHVGHSLGEYADVPQYLAACRVMVELATGNR